MTKTFDQGKDKVAKLCGYFAVNHKSFLAHGVKEAHIRQSLIDPFFVALGWDVRNDSRIAPQYREVVPEDSLDIEGQRKALVKMAVLKRDREFNIFESEEIPAAPRKRDR